MEYNKLGEITEVYDSLHKTPKKYSKNGYPMIRVKDVKEGFLELDFSTLVDEKVYEEFSKKYKPKKGDIILSRVGTYGVPMYINIDAPLCLGQNTVIISPLISSKYLFYYMKSHLVKNQIEMLVTGSTQKTLSLKNIKSLNIKRFDILYEEKIGNILFKIDEKIYENKKTIEILEQISQTLFKRWFIDFEFPNEEGQPYKSSGGKMVESELGEIPEGWEVNQLAKILTITSGKRPEIKVDNFDRNYLFPIIGASKIMGYTNKFLYKDNILVIGRVGTHGIVQRFAEKVWPSDNTFVITSDYTNVSYEILKRIDYKSLNRGSTQPLITQKDIKNQKLPLPKTDELLRKFENIISYNNLIFFNKINENKKLEQLRDTLLPKLLSGEIEIPDDLEV